MHWSVVFSTSFMSRSNSHRCQGDVYGVLDCESSGGGLPLAESGIPPYISVVGCCESDGDSLDAWRFRSMRLHGDLVEIPDRGGATRETKVRTWRK